MVVLSVLKPSLFAAALKNSQSAAVRRTMSEHRVFPYAPSRFQWTKFKDLTLFYMALGIIPLTIITTCANVFVGPATLSEIPEGYVPKYWEYYRSPITRFLARYIFTNPQQDYEKYLHYIYEGEEKRRLRLLEKAIKEKMAERQDYQAYYFRPVMGKYHRASRQAASEVAAVCGD